jgi:hypothetical protein
MNNSFIRKCISGFLAIAMLGLLLFVAGPAQTVFAATTYNADAAVAWANSHSISQPDDKDHAKTSGECTTLVTFAMQAGGLPIDPGKDPAHANYTGNNQLANWLRAHHDLWTGTSDKSVLTKGDILFWNHVKPDTNLNTPDGRIEHVVLITGSNTYTQWNPDRINKDLSWWKDGMATSAGVKYIMGVHFITNKINTPTPVPTQFLGNPSSHLGDNNGSADLKVCADNLPGNTVYVLFTRPGKTFDVKPIKATSRCVTFTNMDGSGPLNGNTLYESRAALNRQPDPAWSSTSCYAGNSKQQGLCDTVRKGQK